MSRKVALLSNINMNYAIRLLKNKFQMYEGEGYGNELGLLLNPDSSYDKFDPEITFLIIDLMEVLEHDLTADSTRIDRWFDLLESALRKDRFYLVSDAYLWGTDLDVISDPDRKRILEAIWQERLNQLCAGKSNVRIFPLHHMVEQMGAENAFSRKLWYLGGILLTNEAQNRLCKLAGRAVRLMHRTAKKVLLLDLDNTLWGGLAGEADHTPVVLSEDHTGLAYKNLQRVIRQMQSQGVILGIVSKNNEADAMEVIRNHPHMVLRPECFAVRKINWDPKHENILHIARELNLGTDSFVYFDDSEAERDLVKRFLPEVTVADFPDRPEDLAVTMVDIYRNYFEKDTITPEDLEKTEQYASNAKRGELQEMSGDFESYLKALDIVITRVKPLEHVQRLLQLINKTNQFNLTARRLEPVQLQAYLEDKLRRFYLYQVSDCFGDNGIVAAVEVALPGQRTDGCPVVENFIMSCRVMGRNIEFAVMEDMEEELRRDGWQGVRGIYRKTAKNAPVEMLYEKLGYQVSATREDGSKEYLLTFDQHPVRNYFARKEYRI